jgi:universal stress protein A
MLAPPAPTMRSPLRSAWPRGLGGEIILAHVLSEGLVEEPLMTGTQDTTPVSEARVRWAEERLDQRATSLRGQGIRARWRVGTGIDHEEIVKLAVEEQAELIVTGTYGRGGLGKVLLGSVAERVVRNAGCPVLTVRESAPVPDVAPPGRT